MRFDLVILCTVMLIFSASTLFVPLQPNTRPPGHHRDHSLARRNETTANSSQDLSLNIDPDLNNVTCGGVYEAQISVQYCPDNFYLTKPCQTILSDIGGTKGSKDVDIVFACTGMSVGDGMGTGTRDIKMIFNIDASALVNGANSGTQLVSSNLEFINAADNSFTSTPTTLGVKMTGTQVIFQYIYC